MEYNQVFVQMALHAWNVQIGRTDKFFDAIADEDLKKQVAPGKNTFFYLLGHLIAVNDTMIQLFDKGKRSYMHLDDVFVKNPDRSGLPVPVAAELREEWKKSNKQLSDIFSKMTPDEWFSKHTAMSDEDHKNDPSRNKMSVLLNR